MSENSPSSFVSEKVMVTCRICLTTLRKKNYKTHLKKIHPKANTDDLSGKDQLKISSMFSLGGEEGSSKPNEKEAGSEKGGKDSNDSDTDNAVDTNFVGGVEQLTEFDTRKRKVFEHEDPNEGQRKRFESGDSAFCENFVDKGGETKQDNKLDKILMELQQVKKEISDLKKSKNSHEEVKESDIKEQNFSLEKVLMLLKCSRSIQELESIGFIHDKENSRVKCILCDESKESGESLSHRGIFKFCASEQSSFQPGENLSRSFVNLKQHVKCHIVSSKSHCINLDAENKKIAATCELESKNRKAGLHLGLAAMKNFLLGRPYTDFENDVLLMKMSGCNVGELNHSRKFPARFRKSVCRVVNGRVQKFIKTPLKQTGFRPPVAVSADKGTYKGNPRQFCGVVTVNPGGGNFLEVLTAGQPVVTCGSTGFQLACNMKTAFDSIGVSGAQIKSGVFDGVYDHVDIKRHLGDLYPDMKAENFLFTWDPLHRTGLADKHMCQSKGEHKWIIKFNSICNQLYGTFSWGASHVQLREAAVTAGIKARNLVNFSTTRFANSKRLVYQIILDQFPAIMACLQHYIIEGERNRSGLEASNRDIRDKADKALELRGKIFNVEFLLLLAGLSDIYEQFGAVVQVLLKVT